MEAPIRATARAVAVQDGLILLCQFVGTGHTFLPDGGIAPFEPCRLALECEIGEGVGLACEAGDYLEAIEYCWREHAAGRDHHEINHYFTVSIAGIASGSSPPACEPDHRFFWARVDELEGYDLRPAPLADLLCGYLVGQHDRFVIEGDRWTTPCSAFA